MVRHWSVRQARANSDFIRIFSGQVFFYFFLRRKQVFFASAAKNALKMSIRMKWAFAKSAWIIIAHLLNRFRRPSIIWLRKKEKKKDWERGGNRERGRKSLKMKNKFTTQNCEQYTGLLMTLEGAWARKRWKEKGSKRSSKIQKQERESKNV